MVAIKRGRYYYLYIKIEKQPQAFLANDMKEEEKENKF